jgi:GNAT superfamily N-acetyltransferase
MTLTFQPGLSRDIPVITALLHDVFRPTYGHILSEEQIKFMLSTIFSQSQMEQQLLEEGHRFIMMFDKKKLIGFAAYECNHHAESQTCKLHKLYLANGLQGQGLGKLLLNEVIRLARESDQRRLILNVNRGNRAKTFYYDLGFQVLEEVDISLEHGYFMNDYVLEKEI